MTTSSWEMICKHMRYAHATRTAVSRQRSAVSGQPLADSRQRSAFS
ncbi:MULTISPECIES: hypothetical protein [unclassified Moorena]|nr:MULTISPECIES: hypothetical protein [unclassified Moorena]NER88420.1 hypothetical protein [Moorena sp. SIO3A2]NET68164.1 hypothetical protein [Moorena sp. SIO1G6]